MPHHPFARALLAGLLLSAAGALTATTTASPAQAQAAAPKRAETYRTWPELFAAIEAGRADPDDAPTAGPDPLLRTYAWWLATTKGGRRPPAAELEAFIRDRGDWPAMASLKRKLEDNLAQDPSDERALSWFTVYPPVSRDGKLRLAAARRNQGKAAEADALIRKVWVEELFSPQEEAGFLERYGALLTDADQTQRLDRLMSKAATEDSARRQVMRVNPQARAAADLRLGLRAGGPNAEALLNRTPMDQIAKRPDLAVEALKILRRADRDAEARDLLNRVTPDGPRWAEIWNEREIYARRALAQGDDKAAYQLAKDHRLPAAAGADYAEAEFMAGFIAHRRLNDPRQGLRHYEALARSAQTPVTASRASYWQARALEALGDPSGARMRYGEAAKHTTLFYGQLAAAKLGQPALPPKDPSVSPAEREAFERRSSVQVARRLIALGAVDRIEPFVQRLTDPVEPAAVLIQAALLAQSVGRADLAVTAARRAQRFGVILTSAGYPRLVDLQPQFGLDPALVHGIIRQESGFNPTITSRVGARGLMQVMPATGKMVAAKLGDPFHESRLSEPMYNLRIGQRYLATVLESNDGWPALAAAAYNAGPGRVRQWIGTFGDPRIDQIDLIDWIELIPFDETRNYVQRVLEGAQVYRALIQGAAAGASPIGTAGTVERPAAATAAPSPAGATQTKPAESDRSFWRVEPPPWREDMP